MATLETKPTNGVSMGKKYTVTSQDIIDGSVIFDFTTQYPIVAAIDLFSSAYARKPLTGSVITYPADGQVEFNFGGTGGEAEVTDITAVQDIARSLSGKYFTLNSPTVGYYVWYNTGSNVAEVTYIDCVADVARNLSGLYFTLNTPSTAYYVWINTGIDVAQSVDIVTVADVASSLNSTYFTIDSPTKSYYVWLNVAAAGTDPLVAGKTSVEVNISIGATNVAVATAIKNALDLLDDFSATLNGHTVTVVNATVGYVTNVAADGTAQTHFTITTTVVGDKASVNPNVAGKTGIEVTITPGDLNSAVATKVKNVLNAMTGIFTAGVGTNRVTVTNVVAGINTDATAGTSGFSITVHTQGDSASVDPTVAGKTGVEITIIPGETANNVASKTQVILDAMTAIFDVTVLNAIFTVTNHVDGTATDATVGNSGFTKNVTTQGENNVVSGDIITVIAFRDNA